jgi:hypothetical protein
MGYRVEAFEGQIIVPDPISAFEGVMEKIREWNDGKADWYKIPENYIRFSDMMKSNYFHVYPLEDVEGVYLGGFDGTWEHQDELLQWLAPYCTPESFMAFRGDWLEVWKWTPKGVYNGYIVWDGE